jgi:hypothetical protein
VEIVFEGKVSSQLAQNKKNSSAQRSEQYLNQNYFFAEDLQEEKTHI